MIPALSTYVTYTADGSTAAFTFNRRIYLPSDLVVYTKTGDADPVEVSGDDVSVVVATDCESATATFSTAPAAGTKVYLYRETVQTQDINISNTEFVPPSVVEKQLDRQTMMIQEMQEQIGRAFAAPVGGSSALSENHTIKADSSGAMVDAGLAVATTNEGIAGQVPVKQTDGSMVWQSAISGGGDMLVSAYDPAGKGNQVLTVSDTSGEGSDFSKDTAKLASRGDVAAWAAASLTFDQAVTGGFYEDDATPPLIHRIGGRILLGPAVANDGLRVNVATSWVGKTDDPSIDGPGQPNMAWIENQATLAVSTTANRGGLAVSGYGQTKGANAGSFTIGLNGFVYNNNDVNACAAEALYLDAKRANENVLGATWCAEMAITNLGDFRRVGPWHSEGGATMGVHIQAGGGTFTNGNSTDVSLALRFASNGAKFDRLIVASATSARDYTDAHSDPYRIMISTPNAYAWEWVNGDDDMIASIKGVGLDTAQAVGFEIGNRQILLKDLVTGNTQFTAGGVASGVNYVSLLGGATGNGVQVLAKGSDTNVDLYLGGKGTGYVRATSHLNLTGVDLYRSGVKVAGERKTGWGNPSGTLSRAAYASYDGTTHGAAYSQTDIQTVDDELKVLSQTLAALLTDMHASTSGHGLIGPTP